MDKTLLSTFRGKKILITGSTGFKGSWLSIWLNNLGASVYGYAFEPLSEKDNFVVSNISDHIKQEYGDICDYFKLKECIDNIQPEIIFHLAAQPIVKEAYDNPLQTIQTNVLGTANLFEISKSSKSIKVIINVTSDKCYLNLDENRAFTEDDKLGGKDIYSASKACSEIINFAYYNSFFMDSKISISSVRAGNVIGGGDWQNNRIVPDAMRAYENNQKLLIRMPNATRPWQHVIEPLMGYLILAEKMYLNPKVYDGPWNMGPSTKKNMTVGELISKLSKKIKKLDFKTVNNDIYEPNYLRLSSIKSKERLGWQKVLSDDEMVDLICDWHLKYKDTEVYSLCTEQIKFYMEKFYERSN
jgi:CDP-glucose 4,6-dehydratase